MSRNLVICCDGTNNEFGPVKTNVARLAKVLVRNEEQLVFYDPGVGTLPEPTISNKIRASIRKKLSLAFGFGLKLNVQEAYTFLMNYWEPGDRVYLFGFSRGAYTVRVLAGLLRLLGLPPKGNEQLVPYAMELLGAIREQGSNEGAGDTSKYWRLVNEFRGTFARSIPGQSSRMFRVHFCGVWDTVSSVGWVWEPITYPFTFGNPGINTVRHAVSIDERRWFFRQNLFKADVRGQDFLELWFPGVHADVGGGYGPDEGGIWKFAFEWMVEEARQCGLQIDQKRLDHELGKDSGPVRRKHLHESLEGCWWLAEVFPKWVFSTGHGRHIGFGLGGRRTVPQGAKIHRSALRLIRDPELAYRPPNLSQAFLDRVVALPGEPPQFLRYD